MQAAAAVRHARLQVLARTAGQQQPGARDPGAYDPITGLVTGAIDDNGKPVRYVDPGNLSILGGDSWKWLLVGPVSQ